MNGVDRVRLQRKAGVREIVSDIDALKLKHGFSKVVVLTPQAETKLRLGQKSLKPIRVEYKHSETISAVICFTMLYPSSPLILESVSYHHPDDSATPGCQDDGLRAAAEETLRAYLLSRTEAQEGYAVQFTEQFFLCQWPGCDNSLNRSSLGTSESVIDQMTTYLSKTEIASNDLSKDIDSEHDGSNYNDEDNSGSMGSPPTDTETALADTTSAPDPYKCRKCRRIVFTSAHLAAQHLMTPRAPPSLHLTAGKDSTRRSGSVPCPSLLLDPDHLQWLSELVNSSAHISGALPCPHCNTKLGVFDWSGSKCSCGQWVAPCFKVTDSKVDMPVV